ncbi:hypothetical protein G6F63_015121 [Rhizopus arrhizus]|nr:hypothetical protein G6F63_015121 [Rhizopus arrhizus]
MPSLSAGRAQDLHGLGPRAAGHAVQHRVFQRQNGFDMARVARAAAAAFQLPVDACGFMPFGQDDMQAAGLARGVGQWDVGAAPRHVGGDGDVARLAGFGNDLGFAGVLLGVQHFVRQLGLLQEARQQLGVFDAGGAHQHGLAALT